MDRVRTHKRNNVVISFFEAEAVYIRFEDFIFETILYFSIRNIFSFCVVYVYLRATRFVQSNRFLKSVIRRAGGLGKQRPFNSSLCPERISRDTIFRSRRSSISASAH